MIPNGYVLVRVTHDCDIALPDGLIKGKEILRLHKGDVVTIPRVLVFPLWKRGYVEIINTEANTHDMAKSGAESMANVEG